MSYAHYSGGMFEVRAPFLDSPTLASLRFFEAAARLESFKLAASELNVTQGAVSQQIKHLERALGQRLFHRLPRRLCLSDDGARFAAVVAQALAMIRCEAEAIMADRAAAPIRLRVSPSLAMRWLVPRLGDFYARHPGQGLVITAAYGQFEPGPPDFDVAIEAIGEPPSGFCAELLMDEQLLPVCSPRYRDAHGLETVRDLAACTLLHDAHAWPGAARDSEWRDWLDGVDAPGVRSRQEQFFSLAHLAIEAALNDQGVAMGRGALVDEALERGQLVAPFAPRVRSRTRYWLLYPEACADRPAVLAFRGWLRGQAATVSN